MTPALHRWGAVSLARALARRELSVATLAQALIERKEHPRRKLVGLDIDSNEAAGHGDSIYVGRAQIGVVTSSMRSPILGKNIALARVDALNSGADTEIEVGKLDGHQKRLPGRIVKFAHYDPEKTRPRS